MGYPARHGSTLPEAQHAVIGNTHRGDDQHPQPVFQVQVDSAALP